MLALQNIQKKLRMLQDLSKRLPYHLPHATFDSHVLYLDDEDIEDIGYSGALNRRLEIIWGYKKDGLKIMD